MFPLHISTNNPRLVGSLLVEDLKVKSSRRKKINIRLSKSVKKAQTSPFSGSLGCLLTRLFSLALILLPSPWIKGLGALPWCVRRPVFIVTLFILKWWPDLRGCYYLRRGKRRETNMKKPDTYRLGAGRLKSTQFLCPFLNKESFKRSVLCAQYFHPVTGPFVYG